MSPDGSGQRAPWGSLSREQIITAAIALVEGGDFAVVTIRRIARDLGVAPMSLYRHVRDKDDLLDEVVDRLLARVWRPTVERSEWRAWIGEATERFRDFLVSQPAALHVFLSHPVTAPAAMARMEEMTDVLGGGGLDPLAARRAFAAIHTYTIGFAALEASRARSRRSDAAPGPRYAEVAAFATPRQFHDGLALLLAGIETEVVSARAAGHGRPGTP